jgi:hypothetical protein
MGYTGLIEGYALADLYSWLEAHSGLSLTYGNTTVPTIEGNISSLNTNTTVTISLCSALICSFISPSVAMEIG